MIQPRLKSSNKLFAVNIRVLLSLMLAFVLALVGMAPPVQAQEGNPDPPANNETPRKMWDPGTPIGLGHDANGSPISTIKVTLNSGSFTVQDTYIATSPGGTVSMSVSNPVADIDHWQQGEQHGYEPDVIDPPSGGTSGNYLWRCASGLFVPINSQTVSSYSTAWQAPTTPGIYTLELQIEDKPLPVGDNEDGSRDDGAPNIKIYIAVTSINASMKALQVKPATATTPEVIFEKPAGQPYGGFCDAALEVALGPALRYAWPEPVYDPAIGAYRGPMRVRVEEKEGHAADPSAVEKIWDPIGQNTRWEKRTDAVGDVWQYPDGQNYYPGGLSSTPFSTDQPERWRTRWRWNTAAVPTRGSVDRLWRHNGLHTLSLVRPDDLSQPLSTSRSSWSQSAKVVFPNGHTNGQIITVETTVAPKEFDVQNLIIKDVVTSADNADFIKFDRNSNNMSLAHPFVTFTVEGVGDPGLVEWNVGIRDTRNKVWATYVILKGQVDLQAEPGHKKVISTMINNPDRPLGETQKNQGGTPTDLTEWGTYTFEIAVQRIDAAGYSIGDYQFFRSAPDKLAIPEKMPGVFIGPEQRKGHYIEFAQNETTNSIGLEGGYYFEDQDNVDPASVRIALINPSLEQKATITRTGQDAKQRVPYNDIPLYTLISGEGSGTFIGLFSAEDNHALEYRDHHNRRTLAVNVRPHISVTPHRKSGPHSIPHQPSNTVKGDKVQRP